MSKVIFEFGICMYVYIRFMRHKLHGYGNPVYIPGQPYKCI